LTLAIFVALYIYCISKATYNIENIYRPI